MATKMYFLCVLVSLLAATNCLDSWEIENRFSEMDKKLEAIDKNLDRLNSFMAESKLHESGVDENDETTEVIPPVTLLEVRRQAGQGDDVIFFVKYRPNFDNVVIKWKEYYQNSLLEPPTEDVPLADGVREAQFVTPFSNLSYSILFVRFFTPATFQDGLDLQMYMGLGDAVETDFVMPFLKIQPAGDFVYEEGQDIYIKLTAPYEERPRHPRSFEFDAETTLIDQDSGGAKAVFHLDTGGMFELIDQKKFTDTQELTMQIKTSQNETSGFIIFSSIIEPDPETSFIRSISVTKSVILRPSTQDGPYPEGYLNFLTYEYQNVKNGIVQKGCQAGLSCPIECVALGEGITDLHISEVEDDGTRTEVENVWSSDEPEFSYGKAAAVILPGRAVGKDTYECEVENSHGTTRTQTIQVTNFIRVEILKDKSGAQIVQRDFDNTLVRVAINCTVWGDPLPKITFSINQASDSQYDVDPDEIVRQGEETVAIKYVIFDAYDPNGWYGDHKGRLSSASCSAQGTGDFYDSGYDYFSMENLPEEVGK